MRDEGAKLRECVPEMSEAVELRLITVDKAMEQLCLRRLDSDTSSGDEKAIHTSALSQLRKWLQWTEERLGSVDQQNLDRMSDKQVRRIAADQQVSQ
uniref:Uncharacterized protein n=1 Tax=Plectus sambesii TaxID=2011161 RepID=A0A914X180_9BILA